MTLILKVSRNKLIFAQLQLPAHLLPATSHVFEMTTNKYQFCAKQANYLYPSSNSSVTKYYLVVAEGRTSISQKVSTVLGCSLHESRGRRRASAHPWQTQTLLNGLLSACHSVQAVGLAPCSLIQLSSSSDITSPIACLILFRWKQSHRFKNK